MEAYIFQGKISTLARIAEFHMVKVDIPVGNNLHRVFFFLHIRNFRKNLGNSVCGCFRNHDHYKNERNHHKRHQHLHGINNNTCHLSCLHAAEHDTLAADQDHGKDHRVYSELHYRRVPGYDLLSFRKQIIYILGNPVEFPDLEIFSYKGFYYSGGVDVFLYGVVQNVVLVKHLDKVRMGLFRNEDQSSAQKRDHDQKQKRDLPVDHKGHDPGKDHHDRRPGQKTDTHHIRHLYVGDVCSHTCHKS